MPLGLNCIFDTILHTYNRAVIHYISPALTVYQKVLYCMVCFRNNQLSDKQSQYNLELDQFSINMTVDKFLSKFLSNLITDTKVDSVTPA